MSEAILRDAEGAFQHGDLERVVALCGQILSQNPKNPQATLLTGLAAVRMGKHEEAVEWLRKALKLSHHDYVAMVWLPIALRGASKPYEAIKAGEDARALWPDSPEVLSNLALDYFNVKDFGRAEALLLAALKAAPNNFGLIRRLGSVYEAMGRDSEAADQYRKAIAVAPMAEEGYIFLGRLLIGHGNFSQAIELAMQAIGVLSNSAQIHLILAQALRGVRENEEAEAHLQIAIRLDPDIILGAALWLTEDGRFEEAEELFRRSIERRPRQGVAYFGILRGRKATVADAPLIDQMESLVKSVNLPPKELAALHYGLGKASDDMQLYEKAMAHFDEANRLKYRIYLEGKKFDLEEAVQHRLRMESLFTQDFFTEHRHLSSTSDVPIFVIGMIRSGTTLLEQIIASHPQVGGGGEQRFWISELPQVVDLGAQTFNDAKFVEVRERYLNLLRSLQPDMPRVTDKMPMNFYCAGLLNLAFPNAPIIHIKRNPVDTALSIYMTDLAKPPEFAHNKRNIVDAYREYERTTDFWRTVIPSDRILDVGYEDLVLDAEKWTRRIIEFCGLPWDPASLEFYANRRSVSTPSKWQVRQPIYRTSMEKWRNYEPWLGEFRELIHKS
jgi:tetratricopeptide (TPR) repeat protein